MARAVSYLACLGLFTYFYGATEQTRRHGRKGLTVFAVEVLAFVVADIIRLRAAWSPALTFGAVFVILSAVKVFLIVQALTSGRGPTAEIARAG